MGCARKYRGALRDLSVDGELYLLERESRYTAESDAFIDMSYTREPYDYIDTSYTPVSERPTIRPPTRVIREPDASIDMSTGRVSDDRQTTYTKPKVTPDIDTSPTQASMFGTVKPLYLLIGLAVLVGAGYAYKFIKK
jgi:hypothetical protein